MLLSSSHWHLTRYFAPLKTATGVFADGGLWVPNPIDIALEEAGRLWPENHPEVVLCLGTGYATDNAASNTQPTHDHLKASSLKRLWWTLMGFLDGKIQFKDSGNLKNFFVINPIMSSLPKLDDITGLASLKHTIRLQFQKELAHIARCLLISNFYFVLDQPPQYEAGFYRCRGSIRCRTNCRAVTKALANLNISQLQYITSTGVQIASKMEGDICSSCHRYRSEIGFNVRHLNEMITLSVRTESGQNYTMNEFPQTMKWFVQQQELNTPFGTSDHGTPGRLACHCESGVLHRKRRLNSPVSSSKKRVRFLLSDK